MDRNCLNCHFFSKSHHSDGGQILKFSLDENERKGFEENPIGYDRGWYSLACYMGVWDEGVSPVTKEEDTKLFTQNRHHSCFFFPYKQSMLFPAAVEMQKREESNLQLKQSYKYTVIGLWLAGVGLILNAVVAIYDACKS